MEAPSPGFFTNCLGLDDPNSYQCPEQDVEDGTICLGPFDPYGGKPAIGDQQPFAGAKDLEPRADVWGGFSDQMGAMATADQRQIFVDPGLYSPASENEDMEAQIQVVPMPLSQPPTLRSSKSLSLRTSKSCSTSTVITPPEQEPPKKRKVKKIKKESGTVEELQKRNKFLERNRIAASKCREKKKQYVLDLERDKAELETKYNELQDEYKLLTYHKSKLKEYLMAHANCNDQRIDIWLNKEATKFVQTTPTTQTTSELYGSSFPPFVQAQRPLAAEFPRSRNHSIASYPTLQSLQFDGLGPGERRGSIAYSHGTASLYPSPTEESFPVLSPALKQEPGTTNFDYMPESMFGPEQPTFGAG